MHQSTERYQRQIILEGFGIAAQEKLTNAHVLVIGAGGLGCPILQYLAAAGVGNLGIADDDIVSIANLNRQILYGQDDIGKYKVDVAAEKISALNNQINITVYNQRWNQLLSIEHFPKYNIIVDATDNFATRYLINDACVLLNKPLVYGAVSKYEGQVAVFNMSLNGMAINYRDLFPEPPKEDEVQSCAEAGVLGVLPGIIGTMQATEVIKLITGIGNPLINQLRIYNAKKQELYAIQLTKNALIAKIFPTNIPEFLQTNYQSLCEVNNNCSISINDWLLNKEKFLLVDLRELNELPRINQFEHFALPLSTLKGNWKDLTNKDIVFICQSGIRSKKAAAMFNGTDQKFYSLLGGVDQLVQLKII